MDEQESSEAAPADVTLASLDKKLDQILGLLNRVTLSRYDIQLDDELEDDSHC